MFYRADVGHTSQPSTRSEGRWLDAALHQESTMSCSTSFARELKFMSQNMKICGHADDLAQNAVLGCQEPPLPDSIDLSPRSSLGSWPNLLS